MAKREGIEFPHSSPGVSLTAGKLKKSKGHLLFNDKRAITGLCVVIAAVLLTIWGRDVVPFDPSEPDTAIRFQSPSLNHWMGTDEAGRDIFSRVLAGVSASMTVATGAVIVALIVGFPLGAISGYAGGHTDALTMRVMDGVVAFPSRLLAIALVAFSGASIPALWFAIAFGSVPGYARIVRGEVLGQKEREYVDAGRAIGENSLALLVRHILPNCMTPVMVRIPLNFAHAITAEASLSFLGLGLVPPTISWGQMLNKAQSYLEVAPWLAIFPGLALATLILGFVLLSDALRDLGGPDYRARRRPR
jgi:peptide/nickel transport system permease protein